MAFGVGRPRSSDDLMIAQESALKPAAVPAQEPARSPELVSNSDQPWRISRALADEARPPVRTVFSKHIIHKATFPPINATKSLP